MVRWASGALLQPDAHEVELASVDVDADGAGLGLLERDGHVHETHEPTAVDRDDRGVGAVLPHALGPRVEDRSDLQAVPSAGHGRRDLDDLVGLPRRGEASSVVGVVCREAETLHLLGGHRGPCDPTRLPRAEGAGAEAARHSHGESPSIRVNLGKVEHRLYYNN